MIEITKIEFTMDETIVTFNAGLLKDCKISIDEVDCFDEEYIIGYIEKEIELLYLSQEDDYCDGCCEECDEDNKSLVELIEEAKVRFKDVDIKKELEDYTRELNSIESFLKPLGIRFV